MRPMLRHSLALLTLSALLGPMAACRQTAEPEAVPVPPPPGTRAQDLTEEIHGTSVADPYRWLEDREAPETREWIEEQNAYTDRVLDAVPGREELRDRVARVLETDSVGFPRRGGDKYFFEKRLADQELGVIYLRDGLEGENEVLIDPHGMSEDQSVSVDLFGVRDDGEVFAYAVREGGQDEVEVRFYDVEAREDLDARLPKGRYYGGVSFVGETDELVYARHGEEGPRVYRYRLGGEERQIFGDGYGAEMILVPVVSDDGRWVTLNVQVGSAGDESEVHVLDLEGAGSPRQVVGRDRGARFFGGVVEDRLLLQTNWQAPNGRILIVPLDDLSESAWREIVPEGEAVIQSPALAGGRLFVSYLEDVKSRIESFDLDGNPLGEIDLGGIGTVGNLSGEWDRDEAFFVFTSFDTPTTVFRYLVDSGERTVWDREEVPLDLSDFVVRQVFYPSKDGTRVPMFFVHREGLELDGSNPTLLTGYGGFNLSRTPFFSSTAALWVERGGVYAVANLRGGGEYGEEWHQAGMRENKQNTFDDFIAAAQWLIGEGYTSPEKLAVRGGSNGGLLVGALVTQRPDLVEAAIVAYPLLDMIRYHRFLVARFWVPEYGSAEDPEQFAYLLEYSPYHNVEAGEEYPAVLLLTGDNDTRVAPLHARKMAARLQAANASAEPILLRYHTKAGHVGGQPLSDRIEDATDSLSFLMWQLGMLES